MRKSFSKSQCEEILENQDGNCKKCGVRFFGKNKVRPQYDHINGDHSDNRVANGQAICANCHDVKSRKENVKRSIKEKDINFVKRCPLCHKKIKGKDFKDDVTGEKITEFDHDDQIAGTATWDMRTINNQEIAPGLYIFTVESGSEKHIGKFVVVR